MKVRYIPRAQDDVDEIYESIAANNPNRAQRVEHAIRSAAELLGRKPGLGVATGHEDARRWPIPEYAYAIFYRIDWDADKAGRAVLGQQWAGLITGSYGTVVGTLA